MSATLLFSTADKQPVRTHSVLQMSNSNTHAVLAALGLSPDFWNVTLDLDDFEGALLRYRDSAAAQNDPGTPTVEDTQGGLHIIHCGRRPGYIAEKVELAMQCVREARERSATRCFFA